jgi:hypothetical protein
LAFLGTLSFKGKQTRHVFPVDFVVAEFASFSIRAAAVSPKSIAFPFFGLLHLQLHKIVLAMGEFAAMAVRAVSPFLIGTAQLGLIFHGSQVTRLRGGLTATITIAGGGARGAVRSTLELEDLHKKPTH